MAKVNLRIGSDGPHPVEESIYDDPDGVMRREDVEALVEVPSGLSMAQTVVTAVGVFDGVVMKKTRILTFTSGRLTSVSVETDWS